LRKILGQAAAQTAQQQLAPAVEFQNWLTVYQRVLGTTTTFAQSEMSIAW
jgi:hypothetical protein